MLMSSEDPDVAQYVRLEPGKSFVYHTGLLATDRSSKTDKGAKVTAAAKAAYKAYQLGIVYLVQKKLGPYKFSYMAVRR